MSPVQLEDLYSTHRNTYKAHPLFGKSDHNSILLIPVYKQKLKREVFEQEVPIMKWSDETDASLQDCFGSKEWNMFWDSSDVIKEFTISFTGFVKKCIDVIVPTLTICTYSIQKEWITSNSR
jgi:hypothetical protein